jgi:hypothetical protein
VTEFVVSLAGDRGVLTVDGRESDLFGELVACSIERGLPVEHTPGMSLPTRTGALPKPTVEVTLRLPLGRDDRLTLVRDTSIETHSGETSDVRSTGPGPVALLDRWLAAHPNDSGRLLIAEARELLGGNGVDGPSTLVRPPAGPA